MPHPASAFALPADSRKADPTLIAADEQHFADVAAALADAVADLERRLADTLRASARQGQEIVERDAEVHRLNARLRALRRFGLDLCLGRMVTLDGDTTYVGRLGLGDRDGRRLLVDWRSPAAEPFFAATLAHPMNLASRRRYRWSRGRIADYWDETFTWDGDQPRAALDDDSALMASLAGSRSPRMRDVLTTIQADQDAIIRADSAGALVVDGGPGTGKTVVALHRAAYLLYADPRLRASSRAGVLFVGPHQPYLTYIGDVLPSLGEEGVQIATLRHLVPEGATAPAERDPRVAALKDDARMVAAIEPAVRLYEEPPTRPMTVSTPWADVRVTPRDWADAFAAAEPGAPHNEARDQVWDELLTVLADRVAESATTTDSDDAGFSSGEGYDDGMDDEGDGIGVAPVSPDAARAALATDRGLRTAFARAWPPLEPTDIVGDLFDVPAYLRRCAPWLDADAVALLQRDDPQAWTASDLPLLDAARRRIGDAQAGRRRADRQAQASAEREVRERVRDDLIAADDSDMLVMSMLRGDDLWGALLDADDAPDPDSLAGPFAHVVVDEAQELTDAQWQMLIARCPSRSFTIVGDRAQARHGFAEPWQERLERVGLDRVRVATLTVNYRTPEEIMAEAEPIIRAILPDANVPTSIRAGGEPVVHGARADLDRVVSEWLADNPEGTACVIGCPSFAGGARVQSLTPELAKGLEFDLVVLVDPESFGDGVFGAVDRYVAMTRATRSLVVLASP